MVMIGSCFTDNIGARLRAGMWDITVNPCGTVFNPSSIATLVSMACNESFTPDIIEENGLFIPPDFPTAFSSVRREEVVEKCGRAISELRQYIISADAMIVTFGTSWVYRMESLGRIVGNCHKLPASRFVRQRMSVNEIVALWTGMIQEIRRLNPSLKFIFTVSPVRHLKDGFSGNMRSKATLLLACEELESSCEGVEYFPAYEILIDDLRDYRFYADDMVHPSDMASDYISSIFEATYLSDSDRQTLAEGRKLNKRLAHRRSSVDSAATMAFSDETDRLVELFKSTHPYLRP
jgi:hypothetical protein